LEDLTGHGNVYGIPQLLIPIFQVLIAKEDVEWLLIIGQTLLSTLVLNIIVKEYMNMASLKPSKIIGQEE